ncbi:MAG: hypothetical protein RLY93_14355 [Sumerlaeia bacterium]
MRIRSACAAAALLAALSLPLPAENCLDDLGPYLGTFDGVLDLSGEVEVDLGPFTRDVDFEGQPDFTVTFIDWVAIPGSSRYLGIGLMSFEGEVDVDEVGDVDFNEVFDFDTEDDVLLDIATGRVFTGEALDINDIGDITFSAGFNGDNLDGEVKIRGDVFDVGEGKAEADLDLTRVGDVELTAEGLLNDIICEAADLARNDANNDSIVDAADYVESLIRGDLD